MMFPPTLLLALVLVWMASPLNGQGLFPSQLDQPDRWLRGTATLPPHPIRSQILFIGGTDTVVSRKGPALAKQHHDFIGFTPDPTRKSMGWLSVNHETLLRDDRLGDGGGMTVFRIGRDARTDSLVVIPQTLSDGRTGRFFNVEFEGIVGETGVNCGGIASVVDGRIWTAEEYLIPNNAALFNTGFGPGLRDTSDCTIRTDLAGDFNGKTIRRYQNFNWMVEIDPREAVALRKQYNWGRQSFEGGVVLPDNQTVLLCEDDTPGLFTKFVADQAGDFTRGKTFVYRQHENGTSGLWIEIDNRRLDNMLRIKELALEAGATMFNRLEWAVYEKNTGRVFISETGRDEAGTKLAVGKSKGGTLAWHHRQRASRMNLTADSPDYVDYYGRILVFDPATDEIKPFLEGGPDLPHEPTAFQYPNNHLSNPDALALLYTQGKTYLVICEDLNGHSMGRVPRYVSNTTCEVYLLDLAKQPTVENLQRIAVMPQGAEATGACTTPDGKTLLLNVQHPDAGNPFPYNNALTIALTGFDRLPANYFPVAPTESGSSWLVYDAAARELRTSTSGDLALYTATGKRVRLLRQTLVLPLNDLPAGSYIVANERGQHQAIEIKP
jgi:secreted PhoX family phosphatase